MGSAGVPGWAQARPPSARQLLCGQGASRKRGAPPVALWRPGPQAPRPQRAPELARCPPFLSLMRPRPCQRLHSASFSSSSSALKLEPC